MVTKLGRIHADDGVERLICESRDGASPAVTDDPRRFPNANFGNCGSVIGIIDHAGIVDADLRNAILAPFGYADVDGVGLEDDDIWPLTNALDAAIDEQDRRRGLTPKPVIRQSRRDRLKTP